jgi:ribosome-binding factor A
MGKRQERLAELIKETMGVIFQQEGKRLFGNGFITVTTVRMSKDLGYAFIYLSALQEPDPECLIENIRGHKGPLRKALGDQIKNQVRRIPDLHFYYDDTMDQVERVDQLLKNVDKGNDSDTSDNSKTPSS